MVNDTTVWHERNRAMNPNHYSALFPLSYLSSSILGKVTDNYGAGIWYNVDQTVSTSQHPNRLIKYGVISTKNILADLNEWKWLYVSGRLHKPVTIIKDNTLIRESMRCVICT